MRWAEGINPENVRELDAGAADFVCRAPHRDNAPLSYAKWERNRHIIIKAPEMLDMLKRVLAAAYGGPVIQASEIETLLAEAEPQPVQPPVATEYPEPSELESQVRPTPFVYRPETRFGIAPSSLDTPIRRWWLPPSNHTGTRYEFLPDYVGGEIPGSAVMDNPQVFRYILDASVHINAQSTNDITFGLSDNRTFIIRNADREFVNLFLTRVRENNASYSVTSTNEGDTRVIRTYP